MFWSVWPGLAPFLLSTFPRIPLDYIWILWPSSRREQNHFVFRTEVHSDSIRCLSLWRRKRRRRKTITPGLLISLWAPLAQSVSLQPSLQPSPPSQTQSSSVMPTRALSARVCYARFGRDLTISSLRRQPRRTALLRSSFTPQTLKEHLHNDVWILSLMGEKNCILENIRLWKPGVKVFWDFVFLGLLSPKYTPLFFTHTLACAYSRMGSLSKCTPFDSVSEHSVL